MRIYRRHGRKKNKITAKRDKSYVRDEKSISRLGILRKDGRVVAVCPCCLVVDVLQCSEGVWYFFYLV